MKWKENLWKMLEIKWKNALPVYSIDNVINGNAVQMMSSCSLDKLVELSGLIERSKQQPAGRQLDE